MKNERVKTERTELLYETDGMMTEFDALVVSCEKCADMDGYRIILDRTAFFPEGGGQRADTGHLVFADGKKIGIFDVRTVEGEVYHYSSDAVAAGEKVTGMIDRDQRFSRMQNHGAEHLVCGLIHRMFGYDNVGFHYSDEGLVIDINGVLSADDLKETEEAANRAVFENVPVTVSFPSAEEAQKTDYRSKIDIDENIRLVTIEGYDVCACCAPHVSSTGQLGVIKILNAVPHRQGMRITMIAGMDAYRDYSRLDSSNRKIMEMLSSKRDKTAEHVADQAGRMAELKEENTSLKKNLSLLATESALDMIKMRDPEDESPVVLFYDSLDPTGMRNLVNACTAACELTVCAFLESGPVFRYIFAVNENRALSTDLKGLADDFNSKCMGKGGGSAVMVQGTSEASRKVIEGFFAK